MSIETEAAPAAAPARLREIDELPSPPGWPLLGNALQFERARMHQQVERWVREYGPYFTFRLGTRRLLVVADHAAMGALLRDRPDGFQRTSRMSSIADSMGFHGVFSANGAHSNASAASAATCRDERPRLLRWRHTWASMAVMLR